MSVVVGVIGILFLFSGWFGIVDFESGTPKHKRAKVRLIMGFLIVVVSVVIHRFGGN